MTIRRLHDALFTPTVDRRVTVALAFTVFFAASAIYWWNRDVLWLVALNAVGAAFELFGAAVRILHLRRSS